MWHYRLSQKACQSELLLYYIYKKQFFIPDCKIFPVPTVADNAVHTARNGVIVPSFALLLSYIFPMVFFIANDTNYGWDSSNKLTTAFTDSIICDIAFPLYIVYSLNIESACGLPRNIHSHCILTYWKSSVNCFCTSLHHLPIALFTKACYDI